MMTREWWDNWVDDLIHRPDDAFAATFPDGDPRQPDPDIELAPGERFDPENLFPGETPNDVHACPA
jgi:hypothetical protein